MLSIYSQQNDTFSNQTIFNPQLYYPQNICALSNVLFNLSATNNNVCNNVTSLNNDPYFFDKTKNNCENLNVKTNSSTSIELNLKTIKTPLFKVLGRFSLLNGTKTYTITVGEVFRRINVPEHLNASYINAILRKAKSKLNGNNLRQKLEVFGIKLPLNSAKLTPFTSFTSLSEGEALEINNDFSKIVKKHFPYQLFLMVFEKKLIENNNNKNKKFLLHKITNFLKILNALQQFIKLSEQEDFQIKIPTMNNVKTKKEIMENTLLCFSRLTHCFGNKIMLTGWNIFKEILTTYKSRLEKELKINEV